MNNIIHLRDVKVSEKTRRLFKYKISKVFGIIYRIFVGGATKIVGNCVKKKINKFRALPLFCGIFFTVREKIIENSC
jgi:hypothetical protein